MICASIEGQSEWSSGRSIVGVARGWQGRFGGSARELHRRDRAGGEADARLLGGGDELVRLQPTQANHKQLHVRARCVGRERRQRRRRVQVLRAHDLERVEKLGDAPCGAVHRAERPPLRARQRGQLFGRVFERLRCLGAQPLVAEEELVAAVAVPEREHEVGRRVGRHRVELELERLEPLRRGVVVHARRPLDRAKARELHVRLGRAGERARRVDVQPGFPLRLDLRQRHGEGAQRARRSVPLRLFPFHRREAEAELERRARRVD
eukprot:2914057-Pleurochrysis_carterae.AAC.6